MEEVGRMIGYDSIPPVAPLTPARVPPASPEREFHHRVREMAAAQGFTEVHNYSFISEEMARVFSGDLSAHVQVSNPIASDQNLLRTSLLPGIWKNINDNARHFDQFRLFEIGRAIHPDREVPRFAGRAVMPKKSAAACSNSSVWRNAFYPESRCARLRPRNLTNIPAALATFCTARPTSAVCSSFIPA